jgi:hypothetical protein
MDLMRGLGVIFWWCLCFCFKKKFRRFLVCLFFLLTFGDLLRCVQVMVRCPVPTDQFLMEKILRAACLELNMLPVGVDDSRIVRVFRR